MTKKKQSLLVLNWLDGSYVDIHQEFTENEIKVIKHHLDDKLNFLTPPSLRAQVIRANWAYRIAYGYDYDKSDFAINLHRLFIKEIRRICGLDEDFPLVNGVAVSYRQLELQKILGAGEINKPVDKYFVDIAYNNVAIEYDHIYWHDTLNFERDRTLIQNGYQLLHIITDDYLLTKQKLLEIIKYLDTTKGYSIYTRYVRGNEDTIIRAMQFSEGWYTVPCPIELTKNDWIEFKWE